MPDENPTTARTDEQMHNQEAEQAGAAPAERPRPQFRGVKIHRDPGGRYTIRFASDWHRFTLDEDRDGLLVSPEARDPQTWISIWADKLDEPIVAEDLDDLRAGVDEGLAQLAHYTVESASDDTFNNIIRFERVFTFEENGVTRKRKTWIMYAHHWVIVLTFQGATVEEYRHWYAMANYTFLTFEPAEMLWFLTDRDLQKHT